MSATGRGRERSENDLYETPSWIIPPILVRLRLLILKDTINILEPSSGNLRVVDAINQEWGNKARITYFDKDPDLPNGGIDFLKEKPRPEMDLVIGNPPYNLALEFCKRSFQWLKDPDSGVVCFILRLGFLASKHRAKWMRLNTPSIYVSPKRPSFDCNYSNNGGVDASEYAWFVWQKSASAIVKILYTEDL